MIKNGVPYSIENGWEDKGLLTDCPEEIQQTVLEWIRKNLIPMKRINPRHTSYGMKHYLQHDTHIYLTNNQFKHAMQLCGYQPKDPHELNWHYAVSEKSPAFNP